MYLHSFFLLFFIVFSNALYDHSIIGNLTSYEGFSNCTKCLDLMEKCMLEKACREGLLCTMNCGIKYEKDPTKLGPCEFGCQLMYTQDDKLSLEMIECIINVGCLQKMPDNGKCRLNNTDGLQNITKMEQIEGDWWVTRGVNNQIDTIPCQMNRIQNHGDGNWVANCTLNDTLANPVREVRTIPRVKMDPSGTMTAIYDVGTNQIEYWTIISFPHPEWIFMLWCGANDIIEYAGGIIQTLAPNKSYDDIPAWVEDLFRKAAAKYGLDYDTETYITPLDSCPYHP